VAEKAYGDDSVYLLKHILNIASTHIQDENSEECHMAVARMKQILEKYNNSPAKLNNQYMYLGQTLIAVVLMQG